VLQFRKVGEQQHGNAAEIGFIKESDHHQSLRNCCTVASQQHPDTFQLCNLRPQVGLLSAGRPMARLVGQYWANISSAQPQAPAAEQQVLQALQATGVRLSQQEAMQLGKEEITAAEVRSALKHSPPCKSPGLDGLPVDLYRKCADVMAPLLAKVYTAIR